MDADVSPDVVELDVVDVELTKPVVDAPGVRLAAFVEVASSLSKKNTVRA